METAKIEKMSQDLQNFIDRKATENQQYNKLEMVIKKMNNNIEESQNNLYEEKASIENFIRTGKTSNLITKSLSGDNAEAGVVITPTLSKKIVGAINEKSVMRQIASVENISSRALDVISEDGNFVCGWVSEAHERAETDTPKLVKKTIATHELYAQPKATQSLINDAEINIESWLIDRLSNSFTKLENSAFIAGNGNNKPHGLLSNNQIKTIDAGAVVTAELLVHAINSIDENYRANTSLLMNRNTLSAIQSLKDQNGRFIWQHSLSENMKQSIFGVPVHICSEMPDVGEDNLAIAIGDFKAGYKIVDRSGINLLRDPYTDKPFVRFYAVKRVGADVVDSKAIKFIKFSA